MDLNNLHESKDDFEKVEPGELLEDCWFFGNLLQRKSRMLRSFSDLCTSSSYSQESLPGKLYEETYESIKKLSVRDNEINRPNLITSSLERQDQKATIKESDPQRGKRSNRKKTLTRSLIRAPSLPTSLETEEFQDEEIEFSMGKLIRQASMNYSDTLPPRTKGLRRSSSISRHRSRRKPELESIKLEGLEEIRPQRQINQLKTQTSLIDLESEELQDFKDLGFDFDKKDLSPNVISIIPSLQEKKKIHEDEEKSTRRPYLSEDIETELQSVEFGDAYERFYAGYFDSYLRIQRREYGYAGVLHCMLSREIHRGDAAELELWFRVGEQFLRFSRYEYALVTGLRFVGLTFDTRRTYELPEGSLYDRVCGLAGYERVTLADLRALFVRGVFRDSSDDSLMVAEVLFVHYMLFDRDQRSMRVEICVWALVEDRAEWESFPWGKYSFQILMHYIRSLHPSLPAAGGPPRCRAPRYHLYGQSYALLIWALEAIPALGDLCGTKIDDGVPRCIRWRFDRTLVDLTPLFSQRV